jgi:hypothetical protein
MADETQTIDEILLRNKCLRACQQAYTQLEDLYEDLYYSGKIPAGMALAVFALAREIHTECMAGCPQIRRHFTDAQKRKFESLKYVSYGVAAGAALGVIAALLLAPPAAALVASGALMGLSAGGLVYRHNGKLSRDPIDSNFSEVPVPTFPQLPPIQPVPNTGLTASFAGAMNAVIANQAEAVGLLNALVTALDRSDGAAKAGDKSAEKRQLKAARDFAKKIAKVYRQSGPLRLALARKWKGADLDFSISKQKATQVRDETIINGFPSQFLDTLKKFKLDKKDQDAALQDLTLSWRSFKFVELVFVSCVPIFFAIQSCEPLSLGRHHHLSSSLDLNEP